MLFSHKGSWNSIFCWGTNCFSTCMIEESAANDICQFQNCRPGDKTWCLLWCLINQHSIGALLINHRKHNTSAKHYYDDCSFLKIAVGKSILALFSPSHAALLCVIVAAPLLLLRSSLHVFSPHKHEFYRSHDHHLTVPVIGFDDFTQNSESSRNAGVEGWKQLPSPVGGENTGVFTCPQVNQCPFTTSITIFSARRGVSPN